MTEVTHVAETAKPPRTRSMAWRGIASMLILLAWVVFIVIFAVTWAPDLDLFQNIVILIASLVTTGVVIGVMWMAYGMRYGFGSFD